MYFNYKCLLFILLLQHSIHTLTEHAEHSALLHYAIMCYDRCLQTKHYPPSDPYIQICINPIFKCFTSPFWLDSLEKKIIPIWQTNQHIRCASPVWSVSKGWEKHKVVTVFSVVIYKLLIKSNSKKSELQRITLHWKFLTRVISNCKMRR